MNVATTSAPPFGRYHRHLAGTDFSLEANTKPATLPGQFYVFRGEELLHAGDDFAQAEACYKNLCQQYWASHLDSTDRSVGMACAWGLLGADLNHSEAGKVIQEQGTPADHKRLSQLKGRALAMKRASRFKKKPAAAVAAAPDAPQAPVEAAAA